MNFVSRVLYHFDCLRSRAAIALAAATGVRVGCDCHLGPGCEICIGASSCRSGKIEIGDQCRIERGVVLHPYQGSIQIGRRVFLGPHTVIYGHGGVKIGDDTLIGMHCRILSSEHTIPAPDRRIRWEPDILKPTRLGNDVWLGAGVTVLGGVDIGDSCVVGAGAVVTRDLPPASIAIGVPAKVIGHRKSTMAK